MAMCNNTEPLLSNRLYTATTEQPGDTMMLQASIASPLAPLSFSFMRIATSLGNIWYNFLSCCKVLSCVERMFSSSLQAIPVCSVWISADPCYDRYSLSFNIFRLCGYSCEGRKQTFVVPSPNDFINHLLCGAVVCQRKQGRLSHLSLQ